VRLKKMALEKNVLYVPEITNDYADEPSMGHLIMRSLRAAGEKILLVSGITGEELSAKDLLNKAIQVAQSMQAAGIKSQDTISLVCENRFEFAYVLFGSLLLNVTVAPINLTYSEREMVHAFDLSKPKIIFMSPFASEKVFNVAKSLSYVRKLVFFDDENPFDKSVTLFEDFLKLSVGAGEYIPQPVNKEKSVSYILCSSGTTGRFIRKTH
jgi:4-coumarate--CoA ligase